MKKRLLGVALVLCMVLALMPTALAADWPEASDNVITLEENGTYTLPSNVNANVVVPTGVTATLNLAGYKLTNVGDSDTIAVKMGGTLIIEGEGTIDNTYNGRAAVFNEGTVTLNGGTYDRSSETGESADVSGGNSWYTLCNHGIMTINPGVTVKNTGSFSSMIENGYFGYNDNNARTGYVEGTNHANPSLTINGGNFDGGLNTVKNDDGATLTIRGGTYRNTTQATILNWNKTEIYDGDFECNNGSCVLNGAYVANSSANDAGELKIYNGKFISQEGKPAITWNIRNADVGVSGGVFSSAIPAQYCASGFAPLVKEDGTYGVVDTNNPGATLKDGNGNYYEIGAVEDTEYQAVVDGVMYSTLDDAMSAVASAKDKRVTLLKDVTYSGQLQIPEGVTLDGGGSGGHKLAAGTEVPDGGFINVTNKNVTIQNIQIDAADKAKHAVQFYCVTGGKMEGATVYGGRFTSVEVNGAEVTIDNCGLSPAESAYATIEFGMGKDVTSKPKVTLSNVTAGKADAPLVYADQATMKRFMNIADGETLTDEDIAKAAAEINKNISIDGMEMLVGRDKDGAFYLITQNVYNITIKTAENGKVEATTATAPEGVDVKLTATPNDGYELSTLTVTDGNGTSVAVKDDTFKMPASNVTVEATFTKIKEPEEPKVPATKVTLSADKTTAKVGDTVTLTVTTEPVNTTDTAVITCEPVGIAEVKNDKTVTIKAPGVVTITAKAGDQTASVKITVDCDYGDGCASKDYKDVPNEYTWYHSAVDYVLSNKIMQGRPGKIFDAGATINRAEMAQILYNMAGQPEYTVKKTFPDVPEDTWYYDPVMWAASVGVIEGFQDGTFGPTLELNRQSMVVMIWRYYGKPEPKDADAALAQFPDNKGEDGVWNKDSFAWMVENEYVNGKDGKLAAGQNSNRAQVAQILMKMGAKVEE